MPRPKKPGAPEPKRRSRNGCWPCKNRKVKCDEGRPHCDNCHKAGIDCDYSVRLNWLGNGNYRPSKKRKPEEADASPSTPSTVLSGTSPPDEGRIDLPAQSRDSREHHHPYMTTTVYSKRPLSASSIPTTKAPSSSVFTPISHQRPVDSSESSRSSSVIAVLQACAPDGLTTSARSLQYSPAVRLDRASVSPSEQDARAAERHNTEGSGTGESPPYEDDAASTPTSVQPSLKRSRYAFKPAISDPVAGVPPWSPSSESTAESPGARPWPHPNFSAASETSPLTSVSTPDDDHRSASTSRHHVSPPSDIRRLSVQSLLTTPHDLCKMTSGPVRGSHHALVRSITPETSTFYGYDSGAPDLDIGRNDDERAILGYSPFNSRGRRADASDDMKRESHPADFGFAMRETQNYYERKVEVWISKELEPLPPKLRNNAMNLLYFHHFLNHTARVLVPHDDPQSNPFRTVLPLMAVKHDHLLSLLLAYSASHRARHLKYPEPSLRIAHLVQGVIADLRSLVQQSMTDPKTVISTADLAAAIMLASLEIISPAAIGGSIPWHHHLNLARELVCRMPDGLRRIQPINQEHCIRSLLWSWFAYLDVLGSLSGGPATLLTPSCYTTGGPPTPAILPPSDPSDNQPVYWDEDMERIDCILGFTPRCVFILARIAELARHCEEARLKDRDGWTPDAATRAAAKELEIACLRSLSAPSRPCGHVHAASPSGRWDRTQMSAANRAFHYAALIHLQRRVLGRQSAHPDVMGAALSVLECLEHIERGSSAEMCLIFPMFTAGCELVDPAERGLVLERLLTVERTGMVQVQRARRLMEKVWETGRPWETLVDAEFIG
ncbi:c6 zinc finger domain-containing protein [Coniochaeta sp. 2T2.1]|nr:c6 zinc finger domain-containing protein [Coniochaeta sp. 2T2.1]